MTNTEKKAPSIIFTRTVSYGSRDDLRKLFRQKEVKVSPEVLAKVSCRKKGTREVVYGVEKYFSGKKDQPIYEGFAPASFWEILPLLPLTFQERHKLGRKLLDESDVDELKLLFDSRMPQGFMSFAHTQTTWTGVHPALVGKFRPTEWWLVFQHPIGFENSFWVYIKQEKNRGQKDTG